MRRLWNGFAKILISPFDVYLLSLEVMRCVRQIASLIPHLLPALIAQTLSVSYISFFPPVPVLELFT